MSKRRLRHKTAAALADLVMAALRPGCDRIEVAGSIRRGVEIVGDIEIVAIPRMEKAGLFGAEERSALNPILEQLAAERKLWLRKGGDRHKSFLIQTVRPPVQLDLFLTTAAGWGYQLAIRTGPEDFSRHIVTRRHMGGPLAEGYRCHAGYVWSYVPPEVYDPGTSEQLHMIDGLIYRLHPVPEEADFFNLLNIGYVPPEKRRYR